MKEYLLVLLFPPEEKIENNQKRTERIIKDLGGKILCTESRLEKLAYAIKKQKEANLLKVFFALETKNLINLKKDLKKKVDALKYLLVKFPYSKIERNKKETRKKKKTKISRRIDKKFVNKNIKKTKKTEKLDKALEKILKE